MRGLDELLVLTDLGDAFGLETDLVETAVDDRFGELVFCLTDDDLAVLLVLIVFDFGANLNLLYMSYCPRFLRCAIHLFCFPKKGL